MSAETAAISPTVAAHVLWCYDEHGGMEPGSFTRGLIALIGRADPANRYKLSLGFPEYVAACQEIETPGSGAEALQVLAKTPTCGRCRRAPVWRPGEEGDGGRFCADCIDRCHESTDFAHACVICDPDQGGAR